MKKLLAFHPLILALPPIIFLFPTISRPLIGDEAIEFLIHWSSSWKTLLFFCQDLNCHGLFIILSRFSMIIFGDSEISFRLPAIIAGIFSAPLVCWLALALYDKRSTAIWASYLLILSTQYLFFSQEGKSYSLTMLLSMVMVIATVKILESSKITPLKWECLLVTSGACMILLAPPNVYFLAGIGLYFLVLAWHENGANASLMQFVIRARPYLVLFALVGVYFLITFDHLMASVKLYEVHASQWEGNALKSLGVAPDRLISFLNFFSAPWGKWIYLFFLLGFFSSIRSGNRCFLLFVFIFITPLTISFINGIMGLNRTHIFWLPFVILLTAEGISLTCRFLERLFPDKLAYYPLVIFIAGAMGVQPVQKHISNIAEMLSESNTKIKDAEQLFSYIKTDASGYDPIVVSFHDRVLRHYLDPLIATNMLNIFQKGRIDRILFITKENALPGLTYKVSFLQDEKKFNIINAFGDLSIYQFKDRFSLISENKSDLEGQIVDVLDNPSMYLRKVYFNMIEGNSSLRITKNTDEDLFVELSLKTRPLEDIKFILLCYARAYAKHANSKAILVDNGYRSPDEVLYLNQLNAVFRVDSSGPHWQPIKPTPYLPAVVEKNPDDFRWQIVFSLYPVNPNQTKFNEVLTLYHPITWWDGFKVFASK